MVKKILQRLEEEAAIRPNQVITTWQEADRLVRTLPARVNLVIPKSSLRAGPPFKRSFYGRGRGAKRQYRDANPTASLHVKEFDAHWIIHVDDWNPHHHVVRHLMIDRGYNQFLHLHLLPPSAAAGDVSA